MGKRLPVLKSVFSRIFISILTDRNVPATQLHVANLISKHCIFFFGLNTWGEGLILP
jgi:hypothetical protein